MDTHTANTLSVQICVLIARVQAHGQDRTVRCRLFLTMHKGFGRFAAWQFWYEIARLTAPEEPDSPTEEAQDAAWLDITSSLLWDAFKDVWERLEVRV
jgi:hypothetical protein